MGSLSTVRGYDFYSVSSSMQKAIRRGDAKVAGYFALELEKSGYHNYVWKRLFTVSAEDCYGLITDEIYALYKGWELVNTNLKKGEPKKGRIFISKAVILLSMSRKSRDADHLQNIVYDLDKLSPDAVELEISTASEYLPIPGYAYDVHTMAGKAAGLTKADFFKSEHKALEPFQPGLFDDLISDL